MAFNFREVEHNLCIAIDSTMSTLLSAGEDYGANAVICYGYVTIKRDSLSRYCVLLHTLMGTTP